MINLRYYNTLSTAFEFVVSYVSIILTYLLCLFIVNVYNIFVHNHTSLSSFVAVVNYIAATCADRQVGYLLLLLAINGVASPIKCILCKFVGDPQYVVALKMYIFISSILTVSMYALFIIGMINNYYLLIILAIIVAIIEFISIMVNLDFYEQLRFTGKR